MKRSVQYLLYRALRLSSGLLTLGLWGAVELHNTPIGPTPRLIELFLWDFVFTSHSVDPAASREPTASTRLRGVPFLSVFDNCKVG